MSEHDDQGDFEQIDRVLDRAHDRLARDLARVAHDEQVAEAHVEYDLGGETRVTAPEQHGCRALCAGELMPVGDILVRMVGGAGDESLIALLHAAPSVGRGENLCHAASF